MNRAERRRQSKQQRDRTKAFEKAQGLKAKNPIGRCFDSTCAQALLGEEPPDDLTIHHAVCVANGPGEEGRTIAHAWLQWEDKAFDTTWGVLVPADKYRADMKISHEVVYTREEFKALVLKHDRSGPFDPIVQAVTPDGRRDSGLDE